MNADQRAWLYRIAVAVVAIAVFYGVITESEIGLWLALAAAVLSGGGNIVASRHVTEDDGGKWRRGKRVE